MTNVSARPPQKSARPRKTLGIAFLLVLFLLAGRPVPAATAPDPAAKKYLTVTQSFGKTKEWFNQANRITRKVTITGKTVVFDGGTRSNDLFTTFSGKLDIKEMNIFAETLLIRSPLRLPQTKLTIRAKRLQFEDPKGALNLSSIDTTPRSNTATRPKGNTGLKGSDGHNGGGMWLILSGFGPSDTTQIRMISRGGNGQPAGLGRNGQPGKSMKTYDGSLKLPAENRYPLATVCLAYGAGGGIVWGKDAWPANGENAVAAGRPGNAGSGNDIYCTILALKGFSDQGPGQPGLKGEDTFGGTYGLPQTTYHVAYVKHENVYGNRYQYDITETHVSQKGKDAVAPGPLGYGHAGRFYSYGTPGAWFHPFMLKNVLAYGKDVFANGDLATTRSMMQDYLNLLSLFKNGAEYLNNLTTPQKKDIETTRQQMVLLYQKSQLGSR